ncbi:hypothetical protein EV697_1192 [Bisgaardia hudsonensis]|uniref:Uncharacterized protein n=1 Tax=Bisgaardia hudsonensis TaxID=109472 RepID=A0A4R2MWQ8_9PAST|nr:hypothetical protein [Bisgaardia hudsonensis]QLB12862.1 hypothetical protein A6A11_04190 [Bisgaardia hudsonensis]TCP10707.1 hypothetical protein EV697_1192 [Bisgaardia hudsonensis]
MKLNFTLIILMSVLLSACGWEGGGVKPARNYYSWRYPDGWKLSTHEWVMKRREGIIACNLDFMSVDSSEVKNLLCFEARGWYLEEGPVCEDQLIWDDPECIKWRKKHSKPDAVPWTKKID